jgi:hypothetical protein
MHIMGKSKVYYCLTLLEMNECRRRGNIPSYPMEDNVIYIDSTSELGYLFYEFNKVFIISKSGLWVFGNKVITNIEENGEPDITGLDKALDHLRNILIESKYCKVEKELFQIV